MSSGSIELLDTQKIRAAASRSGTSCAFDLEVRQTVGSTNEVLFNEPASAAARPRVLFAEVQEAGRGRRGRRWIAPIGSGLTFSVARSFARAGAELGALSLAVGIAVARVLHDVGALDVRLKWPNDVVCDGRKLGGILTQLRTEPWGASFAVIGLGLNLQLPSEVLHSIEAELAGTPGDLRTVLGAATPGRNELAGRLVADLLEALADFDRDGFAPLALEWQRLDALRGLPVEIAQPVGRIAGIARGVDDEGALLVEIDGELQRVVSAEVTVRARGGGVA